MLLSTAQEGVYSIDFCGTKYGPEPEGNPGAGLRCSVLGRLRQIVAERSPDHVVHGLGRNSERACAAVIPGPAAPRKVGVLNSPSQAAFRALGYSVPETKASLHDETS